MSSPPKRKGDRAELEVQGLLSGLLGVPARRALGAGRKDDIGDITGVGKLTGTQAATPGATQGITLPVRCGVRHLLNFQVQDAAGAVGPKRPTAATFTPKPC